MKKIIIISIFFITLFLFSCDRVNALSRSNYDISFMWIYNDIIWVNGWAFLTKNQDNVHNINPIHTFQLKGKTKDGKSIVSPIYNNTRIRESYSNPYDNPDDFSKAYFNKSDCAGIGCVYPKVYDGTRAEAISKSLNRGNVFAINLGFSFGIPVSDLTDMIDAGTVEIWMELKTSLSYSGNNITVYGKSFNVSGLNGLQETWEVAIMKDRFFDFQNQLNALGIEIDVKDAVSEATVVAKFGMGRPADEKSTTLNLDSDYYYYIIDKKIVSEYRYRYKDENGYTISKTPIYYYNYPAHGSVNSTYDVVDSKQITMASIKNYEDPMNPGTIYATNPSWAYKVRIKDYPGSCSTYGNCLINDPNGPKYAWIPSFWVLPKVGSRTTIVPKKKNEEPEPPTPPVVVDPCEGLTGRDLYCCKNSKDDPLCKQDICVDRPEEGYYCKDEEDSDSENKNGTCYEGEDGLSIDFRYPSDGDHHTVLTNDACTISCQENLKLTFQPSQFVRAGMGYTYPVGVKGSRTCIAAYSNQTWKAKMSAAVSAAKVAYDQMKTYLQSANDKADDCGTKTDSLPASGLSYVVPAYKATGVCYENGCGVCVSCTTPTCNPNPCGPNHDYLGNYNVYALNNTNKNLYTTASNVSNCSNKNSILGLSTLNFLNRNINIYLVENNEEEEPVDPCKDITPSPCPAPPTIDCSAVYCTVYSCSGNKRYWDEAQTDIKSDLDKANTAKIEYERQKAIIDNLNKDRQTCDNWVTQNKYLENDTIDMEIEGDTIDDQSSYSRVGNGTYTENDSTGKNIKSDHDVAFCNYGPHGVNVSNILFSTNIFDNGTYCLSTFNEKVNLYDYWVARSTRQSTYQFANQYFVQDYTGIPSLVGGSDYKADGNKEYTEFNTRSDYYYFALNLRNIGPNLPKTSNSVWSIDPYECGYDLRNKIFPPDMDRYNDGDEENGEYGSMAFMYRQISLSDPFPDRPPRWNWRIYWGYGNNPGINNQAVEKMKSQKNKIYGEAPKYVLEIKPDAMRRIANYNKNVPYSSSPYIINFFSQNNFSDILKVRGDI